MWKIHSKQAKCANYSSQQKSTYEYTKVLQTWKGLQNNIPHMSIF